MERITLKELLKLSKDDLKGKLIIFPTDTVYGVGCLYLDSVGREKIYEMKKRDHLKQIPILSPSIEETKKIAIVSDADLKYTKLWPGALTIIFKSRDTSYPFETIAIRIPNSKIALDILNHFGPMEVTSVNFSGEKELNDVNEIINTFAIDDAYIVTDIGSFSKVSSTVISLNEGKLNILRQGQIKVD